MRYLICFQRAKIQKQGSIISYLCALPTGCDKATRTGGTNYFGLVNSKLILRIKYLLQAHSKYSK
jgi:hypothetical protein